MYKFAPASADELIVFGAARPGYSHQQVRDWIEFMKHQNIQRVCCLLTAHEQANYGNLLDIYYHEFGNQQVCWAPIEDYHLSDLATLTQKILPFLIAADQQKEKVVVHCAGGIGRTGHVLAAWLASVRGFSNQNAIAAVKKTGRNPHEAALAGVFRGRNILKVFSELDKLLNDCRLAAQDII